MGIITKHKRNLRHDAGKIASHFNGLIVLFVLIFSVLAFGASHAIILHIVNFIVLGSVVFLALTIALKRKHRIRVPYSVIPSVMLFSLFIIFAATQKSVHAFATREAILQLIVYFLFFFCCIEATNSREKLDRLLSVTGFFTCSVVLVGILQELTGTDKIYWIFDAGKKSGFFGPFGYENNFGAFVALAFPMMIASALFRYMHVYRGWRQTSGPSYPGLLVNLATSGTGFFILVSIMAIFASFLSNSRIAAMITLISFILAFVVLALVRRNIKFLGLLIAVIVIMMTFSYTLGFDDVFAEYNPFDWGDDAAVRLTLYKDTFESFKANPVFGWGLGSFATVAPRFLTTPLQEQGTYIHPNNDYLELASESGVVGGSLMILSLLILVIPLMLGSLKRDSFWLNALGVQSAAAIVSFSLMICFDSHLKVPAIAFFFIMQLAILAQAGNPALDRCPHNEGWVALPSVTALLLIGVGIFPLMNSWDAYRVERILHRSQGFEASERILDADKALVLQPENPRLWNLKSKLHFQLSKEMNNRLEMRRQQGEAIHAKAKAVELKPMDPYDLFSLGQLEYAYGDKYKGMELIEKAAQWAPYNRRYGYFLLSVYLKLEKRIVSSTQKALYLSKARVLYRRLGPMKPPVPEWQLREWMMDYEPEALKQLL